MKLSGRYWTQESKWVTTIIEIVDPLKPDDTEYGKQLHEVTTIIEIVDPLKQAADQVIDVLSLVTTIIEIVDPLKPVIFLTPCPVGLLPRS